MTAGKNPRDRFAVVDQRGRECGAARAEASEALWHTTFVNVVYELGNLIRGQVTARITPETWWTNMQQGWVWDLDDLTVNQIEHPYCGSNYFNTGRANGLNSTNHQPSRLLRGGSARRTLHRFINTTLGGIAFGEVFHRAAWLARNTHGGGSNRASRLQQRVRPRVHLQ